MQADDGRFRKRRGQSVFSVRGRGTTPRILSMVSTLRGPSDSLAAMMRLVVSSTSVSRSLSSSEMSNWSCIDNSSHSVDGDLYLQRAPFRSAYTGGHAKSIHNGQEALTRTGQSLS